MYLANGASHCGFSFDGQQTTERGKFAKVFLFA
jgi:hypothetical protein